MAYQDANRNRKTRAARKRALFHSGRGHYDPSKALAWAEQARIGALLRLVNYRRWTFTVVHVTEFDAFRSDPADPKKLQRIGPWPLPENANAEDVRAAALAAVISVDGESARDEFRFLG